MMNDSNKQDMEGQQANSKFELWYASGPTLSGPDVFGEDVYANSNFVGSAK